jgi:hypothetical protein
MPDVLEQLATSPTPAKDFDLYGKAVALGLVLSHWQSDLYIQDSPEAFALVKLYKETTGFGVTKFVSPMDKRMWYEVPFQYSPHWDKSKSLSVAPSQEEHRPE